MSRHFVVTINNPRFPADELPVVEHERYVAWQLECGASGTMHCQIYLELSKGVRFTHILRFWPGSHIEKRQASREAARAYAMKDDDTRVEGPWERGTFATEQGRRTDLEAAVAALREGGIKRVAQECPTAFVKFSRGLRELQRELEVRPSDPDFVPRYWQQVVLDQLSLPADDRTIFWVTDTYGGKGKSRLAKHLLLEHGAVQLEGKVADMAYMYDKEPIVIFDITRAAVETSGHLYSFAEKLKNGILTSTKYESCQKVFKPPHVIFFANTSYDPTMWTEDRVIEIDLNNPDLQAN